jgi:putative transcriptional regulator
LLLPELSRMESSRLVNNIKVHRAKIGMTQEALAQAVGVTRKTINVIEAGKFSPSVSLALAIAKVLQTSVDELFALAQ